MGAATDREGLERRVRGRLQDAMLAANGVGAVAVFLLTYVLFPYPRGLHHIVRLNVINGIVFVVVMAIGGAAATRWSRMIWRERLAWVQSDRRPSDRERELTLRFPLALAGITGVGWVIAAVVFGALNAAFSAELAANVAISIVLGGLVTCALVFLLAERLLRPLTALCLSTGSPARPQLPGVAARALLSWTLGTGVVLLGVALIGVGALHESRYTRERVGVAVLVLSAVGIVVGLLTMLGLARSLADPITALRRAAARVEQGDLDHELAVDDGSEVGLLQAAFNRMVAGLRERERIRDLFGRQVGEDVVRHALERGVALGGETREAAVLFVDIEGSTALARRRQATEVVELLNRFFAIVIEVVATHDGWVNKFEGDAALCVFGAPLSDPDAASHALAAARELRDRLATELTELRAGIGVSAGTVVAGNVGAASRFEYTVIGDPVNEAARLCDLAKRRRERVLASGSALDRASDEEARLWLAGEEVELRGRSVPTVLAAPVGSAPALQ
jgi:adenylate cyclase